MRRSQVLVHRARTQRNEQFPRRLRKIPRQQPIDDHERTHTATANEQNSRDRDSQEQNSRDRDSK
jgi:hypothetical protein